MEQKNVLWIFENWLDVLSCIENDEDRARVWLLVIENTFGKRQVDLSKEKELVRMGYSALTTFAKMRKVGGRKRQGKEHKSLIDWYDEQDRINANKDI